MPVREQDGSMLWHGYLQDITERKMAELKIALLNQRLQHRLEEMQVIYNTVPIGLAISDDSSGLCIRGNPAIERMFGLITNSELSLGNEKAPALTVSQNGCPLAVEDLPIQRACRGQAVVDQILDLVRPDGKAISLLCNASPLVDDDGQPRGAVGAFLDITDLKRTNTELREREARLKLIIEEVKAGYWDWDLLSQKLLLSPEWKRQIGFEDQELLNQWEEWESRLHPDDRAVVLANFKDYIAGRLPAYELEFRLRHKDGSYRWIHTRGSLLLDDANRPYRLLGINFDITDSKQTTDISERRDKMEQAFQLSLATQTIAAIAHELNQPLAAISSYADVAMQLYKAGNPDPQKISHVMEKCVEQVHRADRVIRQLFNQLQQTETSNEPININLMVSLALDFIKQDKALEGFKIELALAHDLPPVLVNELQIQKVLVNLIRNGLESMLENSHHAEILSVTTSRYTCDTNMALVTVCDSGKGLADAAALKTLFQPFHSTKPSGLGMGLVISRALVQAHGGSMWAELNVGNGLSLHFTLPFA